MDFYGTFKSGRRSSKLGEQSRGSDHKYNKDCEVPAVMVKPYAEFRPLPDIDPKTGQMLPGVGPNGQITWIRFMPSVGYAGLAFPSPHDPQRTIRNQASFWLIPTDIMDVYANVLGAVGTIERRIELAIKNSPYSVLFYKITESDAVPDAPREWALLSNQERWCQLLGVDPRKAGIYEPLSWPEEHAIMRVQLISNGGKRDPVDGQTLVYGDGRSPGSVHPCVIELGRSATKCVRQAIFNAGPDGDPNARFQITGDMADPQAGQVFELKAVRQKREDGGEYNVHRLSLKGVSRPVDPQEAVKEWHPWKEKCQVGGAVREPILTLLSSKEQIDLLVGVFGPELVSFALADTPYFEFLTDEDKGAYARFVKQAQQPGGQSWVQMVYHRMAKTADLQATQGAQAARQQPQQQQKPQMAPSREYIEQLITNAEAPEATPGSFDQTAANALFKDMGMQPGQGSAPQAAQEQPTAPSAPQTGAHAPQPTLDASASLGAPQSPSQAQTQAERPDANPEKSAEKFWEGISEDEIPW